jgi:hypothetical protein
LGFFALRDLTGFKNLSGLFAGFPLANPESFRENGN